MTEMNDKIWLVRTRRNSLLGPYTQNELIIELQKKTFSADDEISPALGPWVSAQVLLHRQTEDLTHTSTKNQTESFTTTGSVTEDISDPKISAIEMPIVPDLAPIERVQKRRWIPIFLGIVFVGAIVLLIIPKTNLSTSSLPGKTGSNTEDPFLRKIEVLIQTGQYQLALQKLTEFHQQQQKRDSYDYLIPYAALLIIEEEAFTRAEKLLMEIINSDKTSLKLKSLAHHWIGYSILSKEPLQEGAESQFLDALQFNPKDPAARFNLGRYYLKLKKYSQSLDYFQLAELETPDLWLVHIFKGRAKVELGSSEEARASFKTAISEGTDRWLSYIYYSLFLLGNREPEEARAALRRMLSRDPAYETLNPPPFGFFQEHVKYSEYLKAYLQVMRGASPLEKEMGRLYISHLENPEMSTPLDRWEILSEKEDLWPKVLFLKVLTDDPAATDALIQKALLRVPSNLNEFGAFGYVIRAEAKMRLKNFGDAAVDFQKALSLEPKCASARFGQVKLFKQTGRNKEAESELKTLLSYHPNYIPALIAASKSE